MDRKGNERAAIEARLKILREAKVAKARREGAHKLNEDELDGLFEPIDCYRTRFRRARKQAI